MECSYHHCAVESICWMDVGWERQLARLGHWRAHGWEAMALSFFLSAQACLQLRRPISSTYPDTKTCKKIPYPIAQQCYHWVVQYASRIPIFKINTDKRGVWIVKSKYNSWSKSSIVAGVQTLGFGICHCKRQEPAAKFGSGTWLNFNELQGLSKQAVVTVCTTEFR